MAGVALAPGGAVVTRDELHRLLRQRAEALATPPAVIDRALARCARLGVRQSRSGRMAAPTPPPPTAVTAMVTAVESAAPEPAGSAGVTVASLPPSPAAPPTPGALESGRIIAGYRIESMLGKGGMGAVYRATQLSMSRPVAFKVLAARLARDPTFVGRFKREARAAGRLHHPNLITVHDWGEADGLVFFSMELVEGRSLKDVLKEKGRLSPDEALRVIRPVLEALAYAHGKGVIHRDIKPDNIMVADGGAVKIADLGLSRIDEGEGGGTSDTEMFQTTAGSFMGTPHYMAPEQGRDAHAVDHRCDIYSVGATLYHLVCGRPPFGGSTPMEVMIAAQSQPLTWPEHAPPPALRESIARLMAREPVKRPETATAALAELEKAAHAQHARHAPPRRFARLLRMLLTAIGLGLAAMMVLYALDFVARQGRVRAWNETLANAEREADRKAFAEALQRLRLARERIPAQETATLASCDGAMAEISKAWDAWSLPQIERVERSVREAIRSDSFPEALEQLRKVPDAWRSPEGAGRLEGLESELMAAVARRTKSGASGPLDEALRQRRERGSEAWAKARVEPAGNLTIDNGLAVFQASGSGTMPLPPPHGPLGMAGMRLAWRTQPGSGGSWSLGFGNDTRLVVRADAAVIESPHGSKILAAVRNGQVILGLGRRGRDLYIMAPGHDGRPTTLTLPDPGGEAALTWDLKGGELEVGIGKR